MARIDAVAAVGSDVPALMAALPPLARVMRYGSVRGTDAGAVAHVVDGLVARICIGLVGAAASLDDEAAATFSRLIDGVHGAIALLADAETGRRRRGALARLADLEGIHGLVAGRACRLLLDEGVMHSAEATRRMRAGALARRRTGRGRGLGGRLPPRQRHASCSTTRTCSRPSTAGSPTCRTDAFEAVLPLLRRTIATFSVPERRSIGERVRLGRRERGGGDDGELDGARADLVMPILADPRALHGPRDGGADERRAARDAGAWCWAAARPMASASS